MKGEIAIGKEKINVIRRKILMKGYANVTDIRNFIPCGYERAKQIYKKELSDAAVEQRLSIRGIGTKELLKYIYLNEDAIERYAKEEMENYSCIDKK